MASSPSPSLPSSPAPPSTTSFLESPDLGAPLSPITTGHDGHTMAMMAASAAAGTYDALEPQILSATDLREPPPPYPHTSADRRRQRLRRQRASAATDADDAYAFPTDDPHEGTPLLASPRLLGPHGVPRGALRRTRTMSGTSTLRSHSSAGAASVAPSLAQTVVSLFADDYGSDEEAECPVSHVDGALSRSFSRVDGAGHSGVGTSEPYTGDDSDVDGALGNEGGTRRPGGMGRRWKRYFRPLGRRAYYAALFHLLALNFPYAVLAWVYLFVFTLVSLPSFRILGLRPRAASRLSSVRRLVLELTILTVVFCRPARLYLSRSHSARYFASLTFLAHGRLLVVR